MVPDSRTEVTAKVPERIGKYRMVGQIGHGGMAEVFLAVASSPGGFNKLHVLKLLRQDLFDNEDGVRAFQDEARLAALLNHPNVVQTYEVGEEDDNVYMVMEYLEGENLQSILSYIRRTNMPGGLDLDMRVRIVIEILNGLHYAHELRDLSGHPLNLVHRDVTPHNIFITYDGSIKLLDFGIAKTNSLSTTTQAGTIKGKVAYMAPEQVSSPHRISRRTDIFQIGLVLWEGIVGRRVWEGLSECDVLLKLAKNAICEVNAPAGTDPELLRICQRAIATEPEDRYGTAEEFAADLEGYMVTRGIHTRAKDVGNFVALLFASHRQALRDALQRRLQDIEATSGQIAIATDSALPNLYSFQLMGHSESSRRHPPGTGYSRSDVQSINIVGSTSNYVKRIRDAHWKRVVAAAALGVLFVSATYVVTSHSADSSATPRDVMAESDPSRTVELSVSASPSHARLFLDDAPLPTNPFRGRVSKDNAVHVARAEAVGHQSATLKVRLDRNTESLLVLPLSPTRTDAPSTVNASAASAAIESPTMTKAPRTRPNREPARLAARAGAQTPIAASASVAKSNQTTTSPTATVPAVKLDNSDPWR